MRRTTPAVIHNLSPLAKRIIHCHRCSWSSLKYMNEATVRCGRFVVLVLVSLLWYYLIHWFFLLSIIIDWKENFPPAHAKQVVYDHGNGDWWIHSRRKAYVLMEKKWDAITSLSVWVSYGNIKWLILLNGVPALGGKWIRFFHGPVSSITTRSKQLHGNTPSRRSESLLLNDSCFLSFETWCHNKQKHNIVIYDW